MKKIIFLFLCCMILYGCATGGGMRKHAIDIVTAPQETRIAISSIPFYFQGDEGLVPMESDERFAFLIINTLEEYLQEKGYAAFFIGSNKGLLAGREATFISDSSSNLSEIIENSTGLRRLFDPTDSATPSFENVPKILYPAFVCKKSGILTRILNHPGSLDVTFYVFLIDSQSGEITWSNSVAIVGNYRAIDLELRGFRWGHGIMWKLLKTLD